jgi:hypothetical protein
LHVRGWVCIRWPSVPDFPGQSLFSMACPGKIETSPGTLNCPVFSWQSRICPGINCYQNV